MKLTLSSQTIDQLSASCRIIFVQNKKPLVPAGDLFDTASKLIQQINFKGGSAQTAVVPFESCCLLFAGLGESAAFIAETLERAAASAVRTGIKAGASEFAIDSSMEIAGLSQAAILRASARGAAWGSYDFDTFKTKATAKPTAQLQIAGPFADEAACSAALQQAQAEADALLSTADLANLPGNHCTPQKVADWSKAMAAENGLGYAELSKDELIADNCNALLAVGAGSDTDAKMITLTHSGSDTSLAPIVLVGKTITFDSGGISLKPGKGMSWMSYDKCGGMAVLTAMQMIARINPEQSVIGILTVAENMPGGGATRPGDIITSRSGKTIEVLNTDAEGRLALCDALDLALTHEPAAIVDLATLTGACIMTLGHSASAIVTNNSQLASDLITAGNSAGERLWQLPLWQEHKDDIKGTFADLQNIQKSGTCGTITAGAFLSEFVPDTVPWAHIDIAGTAWQTAAKPWMAPGATLFGARTLVEWICNK